MYKMSYKVTTSFCGSDGKMKLYSALQMMQDCSELWMYESEPAVRKFFDDNNMAQLLASRQVEIIREPEFREELTVTTLVYEMKPVYGYRNTFIYDAKGNPCYKTWSMGAFVDKSTGKLKRIDEDAMSTLLLEPKLEMNYKDRHITLPKTDGETLESIKVQRADIDYNKHLNNANYIRMAMELLPEDFKVKEMRVEYRTPAKLYDILTPKMFKTENSIIISMAKDGNICANIEFYN